MNYQEMKQHQSANGWLRDENSRWVQVKFIDCKVYINGTEYVEREDYV